MIETRDDMHHEQIMERVRRNRPRGVYVPTAEVQAYLAAGWQLYDECLAGPGAPSRDEVLLLPPAGEFAR